MAAMNLKDIMTSPVATVAPEASLVAVAKKMLEMEIGLLPVASGPKIVGVVTDRDIAVRAVAAGLDPKLTTAQAIMTKDVYSCSIGSAVTDACRIMEEKKVRRLLIVDAANSPVGIVSLADVALHLRQEQSAEVLKKVSRRL